MCRSVSGMTLRVQISAVILALIVCGGRAAALEETEFHGAAHGYPALLDAGGKKLADGEFRQWLDGQKLHIIISYKFRDGRYYEESAVIRQTPSELIQEQWSSKELRDDRPEREFAIRATERACKIYTESVTC